MRKTKQLEQASFLRCVKDHQLTVLREDGLYRHLRFKAPGTMNQYFDFITWPGHLCYTGDMGTYVFQRLDDMLQFFRTDGGRINPSYWSLKLQATSCNGRHCEHGATEFDREALVERVKEWRREWIRDAHDEGTLSKEERRELWEAVDFDVLDQADEMEQIFGRAVHDFSWRTNEGARRFEFADIFDGYPEKYTHEFLWCCYALAWGIGVYDQAAAEKATA